jgi:hypothetical protein
MARIKNSNHQEGTYKLSDREFNLIKVLNIALHYNVLKDKAISGLLYYICTQRFGYKETDNLIFEIDLDKDDMELKVKKVPDEDVEKAKQGITDQD